MHFPQFKDAIISLLALPSHQPPRKATHHLILRGRSLLSSVSHIAHNTISKRQDIDTTAGGQIIYSLPADGNIYSGIPAFDWTPVRTSFVANSSTVTFSILTRNDPSFFAFDDFSITSLLNRTNLVSNPGFESGNAAPWFYVGVPGLPCAGQIADHTTLAAHTGNYDFYDGAVGGLDGISQTLQTVPGTTYFVSFWISATYTVRPGLPALAQAVVSGFGPPTNVHLTPATDSGLDHTDGVTNVSQPTVVGNASPRIGVDVLLNGTFLGTINSNQNGTFTYTLPIPLPPGATTVTTISVVGNSTSIPSAPFIVTYIPPSAPTINLGQAAHPSVALAANGTLDISGLASPLANVTIADGGRVLGSVVAAANGSYVFGTVLGGVGRRNFTAEEPVDGAGNQRVSGVLGVAIVEPSC